MSDAAPIKIAECALDPRWQLATVAHDSALLIVLRIEQPRMGNVDCVLSRKSAAAMREALGKLLADQAAAPATTQHWGLPPRDR